jgi:hypothetical protein
MAASRSPDFLQEVKVQTSNFSSEYGRSAGAAFGIYTKNGTNQLHGGLFEYFRNDALDARNFFSANNTELRYNDWGWNVGGPIKKNKLFFFAGEEWKKIRQQAAPSRQTLPDTLELQGNFAGSGHTIDEPGTKTPFPNDIIPSNLLTPDGKAIANIYTAVMPMAAIFANTARVLPILLARAESWRAPWSSSEADSLKSLTQILALRTVKNSSETINTST